MQCHFRQCLEQLLEYPSYTLEMECNEVSYKIKQIMGTFKISVDDDFGQEQQITASFDQIIIKFKSDVIKEMNLFNSQKKIVKTFK